MKTKWINHQGILLEEGMRVQGWVIYSNKYGTIYDKEIIGTIIKKNNKLYVNSDKEPQKNYLLGKFCHNFISRPNISELTIIN